MYHTMNCLIMYAVNECEVVRNWANLEFIEKVVLQWNDTLEKTRITEKAAESVPSRAAVPQYLWFMGTRLGPSGFWDENVQYCVRWNRV